MRSDVPQEKYVGRAALQARLLRLYPRAWRERYADEMLALIEVQPMRARDWAELTVMLGHAWYRALNLFLLLEPIALVLFAVAIGSALRLSGISPARLGDAEMELMVGFIIFNLALVTGMGWRLLRHKRAIRQGITLSNREAFGGVLIVLALTVVRAWIASKPLWQHFVLGPGSSILLLYATAEFNQRRFVVTQQARPNVPANPLGLA